MKILLAYTGTPSTAYAVQTPVLPDDLQYFPTTHASEVNYLLLCHWLEGLGHEVHILATHAPAREKQLHFPVAVHHAAISVEYDLLLIFKVHGLRLAAKLELLKTPWPRVATWLDSPGPDNVLGDLAHSITHHAWGTHAIEALEAPRFPDAQHTTVEHATTFAAAPALLSPAGPFGLYAGRLPTCYQSQVVLAARTCNMLVYALWLEACDNTRILLRPGQCTAELLARARSLLPNNIDMRPGANMHREAATAAGAAFGFCPATIYGDQQQVLSASKFYDYLAMGLPVVLADNVPETRLVQELPFLGHLYHQGPTDESLSEAISAVLTEYDSPHELLMRQQRQDWIFSNATYKHRAEELDAFFQLG